MTLRLAELTPGNIAVGCRIDVRPEQQKFVAPVAESIAEAYVSLRHRVAQAHPGR